MSASGKIAFVIPHKGRESMLVDTLKSICEQDFDPKKIEVLVVSQNESHSEEVEALKEQLDLRIFHRPPENTISSSRNFGVAHSDSEFLAFIDADIFLSPNWISALLATLHSRSDCVIVSAMQRNSNAPPPLERIRTALANPVVDQPVEFLPGGNLFLRRETFETVGGFPEHLMTCEDFYFTNKAGELGTLLCSSSTSYIHLGEDRHYPQMFKKEIWRGQSNLLSVSGRKVPLKEIPSFIVPLGILGLMAVTVLALSLNYPTLALGALVLLLLPLLAYSVRLHRLTRNARVSFLHVFKFYLFYFPARGLGTLGGIFKTFRSRSHGNR